VRVRSKVSSGLFVSATLAVAIAASTVIFSFVDALVLEPLPIAEPDRVVLVFGVHERRGVSRGPIPFADFLEWRSSASSFEELAASEGMTGSSLETPAGPVSVQGRRVTAGFARAWGLEAFLGRALAPGDDAARAPPIVVLSHGFWERRFGSDAGVLGRDLRIDGAFHTVVGVMSPELEIGDLALTEIWRPLPLDARDGPVGVQVTALLKEGVSAGEAEAELRTLPRRSSADPDASVRVVPFVEGMAIPGTWLVLGLAGFAVGLVVLVACANAASLLLARAWDRRRETAVRLALGASRWQIVRSNLEEAIAQALSAGVFGVLLARAGLVVVRAVAPHPFFQNQVTLDPTVLAFTLGLTLVTPILFALGPALHQSRLAAGDALRAGARGLASTPRSRRIREALVVVQLALSLALLALCFTAVGAASRLERAELGFDRENVLLLRIDLPESRYGEPWRVAAFAEELTGRLSAIRGVEAAAAASRVPVVDRGSALSMEIEGHGGIERGFPWAVPASVDPDYFTVLGMDVLEGRSFSRRESAPAVVVSEGAARRYWGSPERTVGSRVRFPGSPWLRVIGVVSSVRATVVDERPGPDVYFPLSQRPERSLVFLVRGETGDAVIPRAAREALGATDPELALSRLQPFDDALAESIASDRLVALFFAGFSIVALLLATVGLYAVQSFSVSQRIGELALRMVLGARPADVLARVVARVAAVVAAGVALGLPLAVPLTGLLRSAVRSAGATLPVLVGTACLLALVALLASVPPALSAVRVDLASALKSE
jgi:predicted permease